MSWHASSSQTLCKTRSSTSNTCIQLWYLFTNFTSKLICFSSSHLTQMMTLLQIMIHHLHHLFLHLSLNLPLHTLPNDIIRLLLLLHILLRTPLSTNLMPPLNFPITSSYPHWYSPNHYYSTSNKSTYPISHQTLSSVHNLPPSLFMSQTSSTNYLPSLTNTNTSSYDPYASLHPDFHNYPQPSFLLLYLLFLFPLLILLPNPSSSLTIFSTSIYYETFGSFRCSLWS